MERTILYRFRFFIRRLDQLVMSTSPPEFEVDHVSEEEGASGGAGEARADQLAAVGKHGAAAATGEQPLSADVPQVDSAHRPSPRGTAAAAATSLARPPPTAQIRNTLSGSDRNVAYASG